ncbi:MAG: YgjV family protein [Eubacteriales bacterium]
MNVVAQIAGILGTTVIVFSFIARKRRAILLYKFIADLLWMVHYLLIGAYSGAALNVLALGRETVFYNKDKKWASSRFWLYLILILTVGSCVLTWEGALSLLPMLGSICAVISFWCTKPLHIRLLAIPAQGLWLIYGILHHSLPGIASNLIALTSIGIGLYRDVRAMQRER